MANVTGKTIVSVALTGNITTVAQHPGLPRTPEEIGRAAVESARAGAAIAHIHVRYPDGRPSMELQHYRAVVEYIRGSGVDLIVNLTTGPGGRFVPSQDEPKLAAAGTTLVRPELRVEHVVALKPEICSLDLNTMWFGSAVVINTPDNVAKMAKMIAAAGTRPELEVFDSGDIHLAHRLIADGAIAAPALFQIVMGVRYGFSPTPQTLAYAVSLLPPGSDWAAFGIGRMSFPMVAQSYLLGGHVRVGLEDNVYLSKGELAPSNAALVEKAVRIVTDLGGSIATVREAREILALRGPGT